MFRRVSLALAVAAALTPLNVQSLGLGEIQSKSYLNQTLDADIELLSVDSDELDGVKVNLASVDEFKRAGIDRPFVLNSLRFEPLLLPNGKVVIRASSQDPIREPFLNFLVEVNWPKGRLVREYTVLLDPPVTLPRRPQPITAPIASASSVARPSATPAATPRPAGSPSAVSPAVAGGEYGPIQPNATLWSIAKGLRSEGESVEQVMMALLDHNPNAFINGNINLLKAGEVLRIPDQQATQGRSREQAHQEFLQQLADWQPVSQATPPADDAANDDPLGDQAPVPAQPSTQSAVEADVPEAQLKLTSRRQGEAETAGVGSGAGPGNEQLQQELLLAREESAVARRESEELRSRVDELESQLDDMRRLLNLQSDELARMQQAVTEYEVENEALRAATAVETPQDIEPPFNPESESFGGEETQGLTPTASTLAGEDAMLGQSGEPDLWANPEQSSMGSESVQQDVGEEPASPGSSAETQSETLVSAAPEPSFMDRVMSGDSILIGGLGAAGALVLGLVGLVFRRRKEEAVEEEPEVAFLGGSPTARRERDTVTKARESISDDNPFEAAIVGGTGLQGVGEQPDALSEVDVYMAYGRYEQAEEVLQDEIQRQPDRRLELKHRLLEVYAATGNKIAFVALAEEMAGAGAAEQDPETWRSVLDMGRDLMPNNALFAALAGEASSAAGADPTDQQAPEPASSGLDFDLDLEALEAGETSGEHYTRGESGLDADLGIDQDQEPKSETDSGFDFDLDLEALGYSAASATEPNESEALSDTDLDLDKLFSFDDSDTGTADSTAFEPADVDEPTAFAADVEPKRQDPTVSFGEPEGLDQGLEGLEFEQDQEEELSLDDVVGSFMPEPDLTARHAQQEEEPEELSLEGLDLSKDEANEVETMLDLAQIYVDMGDSDDARDILEEALKEGDEGQQHRARELLQSLS